ncbi:MULTISPECIES: hypothetical protein [Streptomyces]
MREAYTPLADLFDDPEEDSEETWSIANGFGFYEDDTDTFMKTRKGRIHLDYL